MQTVLAIVGRPNVGKSTLFNQLTKSRDAIVVDEPGVTRDRIYGEGKVGSHAYIVIDTGGLGGEHELIDKAHAEQTDLAMAEADAVLFLVDGRGGLTAQDREIASKLRRLQKPVFLLVNKTDGLNPDTAVAEFFELGLSEPLAIAASHGRGVVQCIDHILEELSAGQVEIEEPADAGIKLAIVGRPNVGKSTLVNRMLGYERVMVLDMPGTTRDSVFVPMERDGQKYTLIDTAGVRKRGRVRETVEKFSVVKALQAIEAANVVIMVFDAQEGITEQDLHMLGFVMDAGRGLVLAVNKWDGLSTEQREQVEKDLDRRLVFIDYARIHKISALHGTGVGDLFGFVQEAFASANADAATPELTKLLEKAVEQHQPPLVRGRRIKLRYAHMGGHNPPVIVVHGKQTARLPAAYKRYLTKWFRQKLGWIGTPIRLQLRTDDNPYEGKRNKLTPRQQRKRRRLMRYFKK